MKKTLLVSVIAAMAMAVTFTSCGSAEETLSSKPAADISQNNSVQNIADDNEAVPEITEAAAAENEPISENNTDHEEKEETSDTPEITTEEQNIEETAVQAEESEDVDFKYPTEWYCKENDTLIYINYDCENIIIVTETYTTDEPAVPYNDRIEFGKSNDAIYIRNGKLVDGNGNVYEKTNGAIEGYEDLEVNQGIKYYKDENGVHIMQVFKNGTYFKDNADGSVSSGKISTNGNVWTFTPAYGGESYKMTADEDDLYCFEINDEKGNVKYLYEILVDEEGHRWTSNNENPYKKGIAGSSK